MEEQRFIRHVPRVLAALFLVSCGDQTTLVEEQPTPPRHLVVISIDTLRADRLGSYGYTRNTSPNLDRLAEKSRVYRAVTSTAPSTAASHMSMLTGVYPPVHGVHNVALGPNQRDQSEATQIAVAPTSLPTLAETLHKEGFVTAAFTDSGYLTEDFQFDRGFDVFKSQPEDIKQKVNRALGWLDQADPEQPTFLFFHTYQVHTPYAPPVAFDQFSNPDYDGPVRQRVEEIRRRAFHRAEPALLRCCRVRLFLQLSRLVPLCPGVSSCPAHAALIGRHHDDGRERPLALLLAGQLDLLAHDVAESGAYSTACHDYGHSALDGVSAGVVEPRGQGDGLAAWDGQFL